ncbi:MAG: glycosyltransferase [Candidatus Micrarchaeaceae archaeon]
MFKGDAVGSIMQTNSQIHGEMGWRDTIIADLFSDYPNHLVLASNDFVKSNPGYMLGRFMRLDNKFHYINEYIKASKQYKPGSAKLAMLEADLRIWFYGGFYTLFNNNFNTGDIIFYVDITPPYLSQFPEFSIESRKIIQAVADLNPEFITISQFSKRNLIKLGYKANNISVLPLFHRYDLQYIKHQNSIPMLLAYGRYAVNKQIPELVEFCQKNKIKFTHFGDNTTTNEFRNNYKRAECMVSNLLDKHVYLSGKILDSEKFEQQFIDNNIYINPSLHEGFSMPAIEAMAHSLPVLLRRGSAMDELIENGREGYLFSKLDEIPELAQRILSNYGKFSKAAYKRSNNYTYEKYKERYIKILNAR